jgi:hypothetical protein
MNVWQSSGMANSSPQALPYVLAHSVMVSVEPRHNWRPCNQQLIADEGLALSFTTLKRSNRRVTQTVVFAALGPLNRTLELIHK